MSESSYGVRNVEEGRLDAEATLQLARECPHTERLGRVVSSRDEGDAELGGERTRAWLVLRAHGGAVALDKTTLRAR